MGNAADWKSDWAAFIRAVGESFDLGLDDVAVTKRFANQKMKWSGKVVDKRFDDMPGIRLEMPPVTIQLADGHAATVDYLFLHIKPHEVPAWKKISDGDAVTFETRIDGKPSIFPGIRRSDMDDKCALIIIGVDGAVPVHE